MLSANPQSGGSFYVWYKSHLINDLKMVQSQGVINNYWSFIGQSNTSFFDDNGWDPWFISHKHRKMKKKARTFVETMGAMDPYLRDKMNREIRRYLNGRIKSNDFKLEAIYHTIGKAISHP